MNDKNMRILEEKSKELDISLEETNVKIKEVIKRIKECFSIYLPNNQIEDFL